MNERLRAFLRDSGVPESELDKLERGQAPRSSVLAKCAQVYDLVDEITATIAEANATLARIEKSDAQRGAFAKGVDLFAPTNGHDDVTGILKSLAKGQQIK